MPALHLQVARELQQTTGKIAKAEKRVAETMQRLVNVKQELMEAQMQVEVLKRQARLQELAFQQTASKVSAANNI